MCRGGFIGPVGPPVITGWPSSHLPINHNQQGKKVAIIGAGISGVTTAIEFQKRGFEVTIFEQTNEAASGGSGNIQGAVYAKLSAKINPATQFYGQALVLAQRFLANLSEDIPHQQCGLVQLSHNERELKRLNEFLSSNDIPQAIGEYKSAAQLSELIGIQVDDPGLWFKDGGWLSPAITVKHLIEIHQINCQFNTQVTQLDSSNSGWVLHDSNANEHKVDQVVICSAFDATRPFTNPTLATECHRRASHATRTDRIHGFPKSSGLYRSLRDASTQSTIDYWQYISNTQ